MYGRSLLGSGCQVDSKQLVNRSFPGQTIMGGLLQEVRTEIRDWKLIIEIVAK